ncbi:hypothetical protein [Paenibacillus sp. IHBB 10380]|uniref:hypothetical protein n=1 Tax=Paenibacillus sp. IHBB 10380 TaxID=1566358 RepID=UPI0005CFC063|nr:hypothetical protein [Paenibacillus sp. IHBB 10380]AJS58735.1 hypothetical protein UB51_09825 [Paenibacillus sp. IHBB 10380]
MGVTKTNKLDYKTVQLSPSGKEILIQDSKNIKIFKDSDLNMVYQVNLSQSEDNNARTNYYYGDNGVIYSYYDTFLSKYILK